LISQLENARANRRQRSVVARSLALLQLPKLKSEVLSNLLGKGQQNHLCIALPSHSRILWESFFLVAPGRDYSRNPGSKYTIKCIFLSRRNCSSLKLAWRRPCPRTMNKTEITHPSETTWYVPIAITSACSHTSRRRPSRRLRPFRCPGLRRCRWRRLRRCQS
jgi:hypothetical protein